MSNKPLPQELVDSSEKFMAAMDDPVALSRWAATFAASYIDVKGVRFYRYSLAHNWCADEIKAKGLSPASLTAVICWMLTFDAEGVQNVFLPLLFDLDGKELAQQAMGFMIAAKIAMEDLAPVAKLYYHDVTQKKSGTTNPTQSPTRTGGARPSSRSRKPSGGKKK